MVSGKVSGKISKNQQKKSSKGDREQLQQLMELTNGVNI